MLDTRSDTVAFWYLMPYISCEILRITPLLMNAAPRNIAIIIVGMVKYDDLSSEARRPKVFAPRVKAVRNEIVTRNSL